MSTRKRSTEIFRGYSRVYGTDEYFEIYILPPNIGDNNVFFPLLSQKLGGNRPQFLLHRNSTRQVYSSQPEVT